MENPYDKFITGKQTANPYDKFVETPTPASNSSFLGGVADSLSKRVSGIGQIWGQEPQGVLPTPERAFGNIGGKAFMTAGQIAGGVGDIAGEGMKGIYRTLMPEDAQQAISGYGNEMLQSPAAQKIFPVLQAIQERYGQAKKDYPEQVGMVEAAANIGSLIPAGWLAGKGAGAVKGAVTIPMTAANIEQKIDQAIVNGVKKGIKPTVVGKSDAGLVRSYYDKAKTAVRDIVDSSPVKLSQSQNVLEDFSKAVKETKVKLHQQYDQMAMDAGEQGALVNLQPVINDIKTMAVDANLQRADPSAIAKLNEYVKMWESLPGEIPPVDAENLIAMLNTKSKAFWRDPNMHSSAALTERIAQQLRKQTFDTVESYQGPGYDTLRKRYGAQLALEKEVADRATVMGRKAEFGFFDLANIPTAAEFVRAALTADPVSAAKAAGMFGIKKFMQSRNDPSNIIRKMFRDVETLNAIKARYAAPYQ